MWLLERMILAFLYLDAYAIHATAPEALYYAALLGYECGSQGIDPLVGAVIIYHESGGIEGVINKATGDTGLMQLKPCYQPWTQQELTIPAINIHAGCKALYDWQVKHKKGDNYLAHYAGGTVPHKGAYGFQKWVNKQVKRAEKRWSEVGKTFDALDRAWDRMWEKLKPTT